MDEILGFDFLKHHSLEKYRLREQKVRWENYLGLNPFSDADNDEGRKDNFLNIEWHFRKDKMVPATLSEYESQNKKP